MELAAFTIDAPPDARPVVVVNGHDVDARAWSVHMQLGDDHPTLTVETSGPASHILGHGIVHIVSDDAAETIAAWLDDIEPEALEQLALAQLHGLDPAPTVGAAWLRALQALAGADA